VVESACPECGEAFESVWHVTVGASGEYQPVFGGPVTLEMGQCKNCNCSSDATAGHGAGEAVSSAHVPD
jgi:hypothetical protein